MPTLAERVHTAAEAALADAEAVSPLDVLCGIGWLTGNHLDHWRRGRTPHLPPLATVRRENLMTVLHTLRTWADARGLQPCEVPYVAGTRDHRPLHFLDGADPEVERILRTHWLAPGLPPAQRERKLRKAAAAPELVVVSPLKEWTCAGCGGTGDLLLMENAGPMCLTCVDLDHLVFLPRGDATRTRRARKASATSAVVRALEPDPQALRAAGSARRGSGGRAGRGGSRPARFREVRPLIRSCPYRIGLLKSSSDYA